MDRHGRPVSPPSQETLRRRGTSTFSPDHFTANLSVPDNCSLGLSIRGGSEFGLGIFVAKVDADSVAAKAGILPGDQILRLNDVDFEHVSHEAAVRLLHRFAPRMEVSVHRVGRLPLARSSLKGSVTASTSARSGGRSSNRFEHATWKRARSVGPPGAASTVASSATLPRNHRVLTHQSPASAQFDQFQLYSTRSVTNLAAPPPSTPPPSLERRPSEPLEDLTPAQRETLAYYLEEYREGHVSVDSFVLALSQLTEGAPRKSFEELARLVGGWLRPGDQSRYTLLTALNEELMALRLKREQEEGTPASQRAGPPNCAQSLETRPERDGSLCSEEPSFAYSGPPRKEMGRNALSSFAEVSP